MITNELIKVLKKHPKKQILIYRDGVLKEMKTVKSLKVDGFCKWTFGANVDDNNKDVDKENSIIFL